MAKLWDCTGMYINCMKMGETELITHIYTNNYFYLNSFVVFVRILEIMKCTL